MLGGRARQDSNHQDPVLILVFREDMLGGRRNCSHQKRKHCLNPCFSGRYAGSIGEGLGATIKPDVLILVFREDMLGAYAHDSLTTQLLS